MAREGVSERLGLEGVGVERVDVNREEEGVFVSRPNGKCLFCPP